MASQPVKGIIRQVKPLLSTDSEEARRRVIQLYKLWYRQIPRMIVDYKLTIHLSAAREKLRSEFEKNKNIKDIRVIDMLVIKGQMELKEILMDWKQACHVMYLVKDTTLPKPTNFISKFLSGAD